MVPIPAYAMNFSNEVWAIKGAYTQSYVTVNEDRSDRYNPECVQHKYFKLSSQMFHGIIVRGSKGPAIFWEKEQGSINSEKYNAVILNNIQAFLQAHERENYIWM